MRLRTRLASCILCLAAVLNPSESPAQGVLTRPLELVVHTAPGGGPDRVARILAEILTREKLVTVPVSVLNKPGGAGGVAYHYMKSRRGDPHTLLTGVGSALLSATLRPDMGINMDDFTPVALLAQDPQAIIVAADSPYRTLREFIDAARRESNGMAASITSPTSSGRMLGWLIEREAGVKFRFVTFKSGSEALTAVMGGHVQFSTENVSESIAAVEAKKLRVLAVSSGERMAALPGVPTLRELGYDIHIGTGRGLALPGGVSKAAVDAWESIIERVYQSPAWKAHAQSSQYENLWMGSAAFGRYLAQRRQTLQAFLQAINAKANVSANDSLNAPTSAAKKP